MKIRYVILTAVLPALLVGCVAPKAASPSGPPPIVEGMRHPDLVRFLKSIESEIPKGVPILKVWVYKPDHVRVIMLNVTTPHGGRGDVIEFKLINGKWTKTNTGRWTS